MRPSTFINALALTIITLFINNVLSWGDLGHRTVGYLAAKYMTSDGLAFVNNVLQADDSFDISDGAVWADKVKRKKPWTSQWHFIDAQDNPPADCKVNYSRDCAGKDGCIVMAILNMTARLSDSSLPDDQHQEAVKFLIHFLGDIHQPLHTEAEERGGNEIPVIWNGHQGKQYNLHAVWDTYILEKITGFKPPKKDEGGAAEKAAASKWADELFDSSADPSQECLPTTGSDSTNLQCVLKWASDANAEVCAFVVNPDPEGQELSGDYYEGATPIVKDMIGRAARRLANLMNSYAGSSGIVNQEEERKIDL